MPKAVRMRSDMSAFAAAIEKSNGQDVTSSPCHVLAVTLFYSFFLEKKNGSTPSESKDQRRPVGSRSSSIVGATAACTDIADTAESTQTTGRPGA